ncbi:MAG: TonB-dependent receptor [Sphingobacteriaceae bacterium]|nr:TonB-dependent receptor [Sphingobacteriaceae bacterium]
MKKKRKHITSYLGLGLVIGHFTTVQAQDTIQLRTVEITNEKTELFTQTKKIEKYDSITKSNFVFQSLGEMLALNSSIYIKSYGPGALSGTSMRGGNASQTAVLWNGINIVNPLVGQSDLNLLPVLLFEDLKTEYGGSSAVWGNGAVAGSILLDNSFDYNRGLKTEVNLSKASYNTVKMSSKINYSTQRFSTSTKFYLTNSHNNYLFKPALTEKDSLIELNNAAFSIKGIMQELRFFIKENQLLEIHCWADEAYRQLPTYNEIQTANAFQKDENFRTNIHWKKKKNKWTNQVKGGFLHNVFIYDNANSRTHTYSKALSGILESENYLAYKPNSKLLFGTNINFCEGISDAYLKREQLNKISLLMGNHSVFFNSKLIVDGNIRQEFFNTGNKPLTGNIALSYLPTNNIKLSVNSAKIYRQPTLNELYWYPGGQINLKPEEGWSQEGNINYIFKSQNFMAEINGAIYSRNINNWILWLPGTNGSPTPFNIQSVWSRGTESKLKLVHQKNKWLFSTQLTTAYTLSTVLKNEQENSENEGAQLIYTPRYTGNANVILAYGTLSFNYNQNYTGYRFTLSDNSQWLMPYSYSDIRISKSGQLGEQTGFSFFLAVLNLFNEEYAIIAGRPMPLRTYEIGIKLNTQSKNNNKITNN